MSPRARIVLAFLTLYLVWGSTYLVIRIGVHHWPPALFAALRWLIAGAAFVMYARAQGQAWPRTRREWWTLAVLGMLFIVGGNGLVVFAEREVPSNLAALIIATAALWIAGLGTLGARGEHVQRQAVLGLLAGFVGVALLMWPQSTTSAATLRGQALIALAAFLWATGTIYARRRKSATPALMATGLQSLIGGSVLFAWALATGEWSRWQWDRTGGLALAYLTVFGSMGFFAYNWLVHRATPAKLGTYAYVNPAIAVVLGWWILDETLTSQQLFGMATIVAGVAWVTMSQAAHATARGGDA